jgi:hypothetical protein
MNAELPALLEGLEAITREAEQRFGALTGAQLNWRPSPESWSIAQCLDHLIAINSHYFPAIDRLQTHGYAPTLYQRMPLLPRLFGSLVLNAVQPATKRKAKTAGKFAPASSDLGADIVARFSAHHQKLMRAMESTAHLDLARIVITSPVASVAIYSLLDAYRIVVAHERRHLAQAERVLADPRFPR